MHAEVEMLLNLQKEENQRRLGADGQEHPFFAWHPRCPPWHPEGGLTFQEKLIACRARMIGVVTSNRVGKSMTGTRICAARAIGFDPLLPERKFALDQLIWVLTEPKLVQGLFKRIVNMIPQRYWLDSPRWSQGSERLRCVNGDIVMKSTGMKREEFQADSVSFLWPDEEPPEHIWGECMIRLDRPDSQCLLTLTPVNGTQFMWDEFGGFREDDFEVMDGEMSWFTASMEQNDTLPEDYIKRMKHQFRNDPDMYAIRIEGKYVNMRGRCLFSSVVSRMREEAQPAKERIRFNSDGKQRPTEMETECWEVWKRPEPGHQYVIGADLAEGGLEGDYTAAFVLDTDLAEVVAKYHGKSEPGPFGRELVYCGRWFNKAIINWEMNMQGAAVLDRMREMQYPRLALRNSMGGRVKTQLQTYGFRTDRHSKPTIIENLRDALADEMLYVPDLETIDELGHFGYLRKGQASGGNLGMGALSGHDDLVMALAIAWHTAKKNTRISRAPEVPKNFGDELEEMVIKESRMALAGGRNRYDGL